MWGGERGSVYRVVVWKREGKNHLEDPGVDGRIILRWIFRIWDGSMDWIDLAQDTNMWLAHVNVVMKLQVS